MTHISLVEDGLAPSASLSLQGESFLHAQMADDTLPSPSRAQTVVVVGLGLLGGSLALALKRRSPELRMVGVDHPDIQQEALLTGAIDEAPPLDVALPMGDVVVLALPIDVMLDLMPRIGTLVRPDALVTDMGSVKEVVMRRARGFFRPGQFIGGHPMAGSEHTGFKHADGALFENAVYVLTPESQTPQAHIDRLSEILQPTGARFLVLDAYSHDRIAAFVSHLPQLLATTLTNTVAEADREQPGLLHLAAGGFRDMTRVASSSYGIWRSILAHNPTHIDEALAAMQDNLAVLRAQLHHGEYGAVGDCFVEAAQTRARIPQRTKGFLLPLYEVLVRCPDEPGILLRLVRAVAETGNNIKDIELLKIREGEAGTFRLAFALPEEARDAVHALQAAGFVAKIV